MAIISTGYKGTVTNEDWPTFAPMLGSTYSLLGAGDFAATPTAGDRRVAVSPGVAQGRGVVDTNDSTIVVQHSAVGSGVRYDMIALRRDWTTKTTTVEVIEGVATRGLPPTRDVRPGIVDEQPLWLVRIAAGSTVPVIEADLRCWEAHGGMAAADVMALSYLDGRPGAHVRIRGDEWVMQSTNGLTWAWVRERAGYGPTVVGTIKSGATPTSGARGEAIIDDPGYPYFLQVMCRMNLGYDASRWDAALEVTTPRGTKYLGGFWFGTPNAGSAMVSLDAPVPLGEVGIGTGTPLSGRTILRPNVYRVFGTGGGRIDEAGRLLVAQVIPA